MIPARPGYIAEFRGQAVDLPVEAFDGEGYALVLDAKAGRLVRAVDRDDFAGVADRPAAVVPGGTRWAVRYTDDDGQQQEGVAVAWSVAADGVVLPLVPRQDPSGEGVYVLPVRGAHISSYIAL